MLIIILVSSHHNSIPSKNQGSHYFLTTRWMFFAPSRSPRLVTRLICICLAFSPSYHCNLLAPERNLPAENSASPSPSPSPGYGLLVTDYSIRSNCPDVSVFHIVCFINFPSLPSIPSLHFTSTSTSTSICDRECECECACAALRRKKSEAYLGLYHISGQDHCKNHETISRPDQTRPDPRHDARPAH